MNILKKERRESKKEAKKKLLLVNTSLLFERTHLTGTKEMKSHDRITGYKSP